MGAVRFSSVHSRLNTVPGLFSFRCRQLMSRNTQRVDKRETPAIQIQLEVSWGPKVYLHTLTCVNYRPPGWKLTLLFHVVVILVSAYLSLLREKKSFIGYQPVLELTRQDVVSSDRCSCDEIWRNCLMLAHMLLIPVYIINNWWLF